MKVNDSLNTPDYIYKQLDRIFNFTIDAACTSENTKCKDGYFIDKGLNGLLQTWTHERVFCNPPFSRKDEWIKKAHKEVQNNDCPVCVMVLPLNCISSPVPWDFIECYGYQYEILRQRISFIVDETKLPLKGNNTGSIIVYFKKRISTRQHS